MSGLMGEQIKLSEGERGYRDLLGNLQEAFYACNAEGYITYFNEAAARLWGRSPEFGKDKFNGGWKIYGPNGVLLPHDSIPTAIALRERRPLSDQEIFIERPDGTMRTVLSNPTPVFNENGELQGTFNMLVDVTEYKRNENALRLSQEQFRTLSDNAPVMIWTSGTDKLCDYFNRPWLEFRGRSLEQEAGNGWAEGVHPDDFDRCLDKYVTSFDARTEFTMDYRLRRHDGEFRWIRDNGIPRFSIDKTFLGYVGSCIDITDQKVVQGRLSDLLHESEERYRNMVEEVQDYAILFLDRTGNIQNWTKGAIKITGYTEEEALGKHFSMFYSKAEDNSLPQAMMNEAIANGRSLHEGWRRRKDGTPFWASTVLTALHDPSNTLVGFCKVTRDLTERKNVEDTLTSYNRRLKRSNQELEQFAFLASHDLQEPLRKIRLFSDRIEEKLKGKLDQTEEQYLQKVIGSAERMRQLIADLLEYSRLDDAGRRFDETDLNSLVQKVLTDFDLAIEEKNAIIECGELATIDAIPLQMRQLFQNLIGNSLKFTQSGITPHIRIRATTAPKEIIMKRHLDLTRNYCVITVADNGIGFPPEHAEKIFHIFQRLHGRDSYAGTGIGLALCRKIVEIHSGDIYAEPGKLAGTTFYILLPYRQKPEPGIMVE